MHDSVRARRIRRRVTCMGGCSKARHSEACDDRYASLKRGERAAKKARVAAEREQAAILAGRELARGQVDPTIRDWLEELTSAVSDLPAYLKIIDELRTANLDLRERVEELESCLDNQFSVNAPGDSVIGVGPGSYLAGNSSVW